MPPALTIEDLGRAYKGKRVLLTGHTGFKGAWTALWLRRLGAEVVGVALPPDHPRGVFSAAGLASDIDHRVGDIRDPKGLSSLLSDIDADLVIHMAAQALVRRSYVEPLDTYLTNVVGTVAVLDVARRMKSLKGVLVVTSDKCYENREWVWGYRENDPMGGADPYSSSKGCAELVVSAYRRSYFSERGGPLLASARAGNVFGGGDWSQDRLVPDIIKAGLAGGEAVIRNPGSIRPWQHVLEPVFGYLLLGARLTGGDEAAASGWNFGPDPDGVVNVGSLAGMVREAWGAGGPRLAFGNGDGLHEAGVLRLDSTKAKTALGWTPRLTVYEAVKLTIDWHKAEIGGADMRTATVRQIAAYEALVSNSAAANNEETR
jgi:CDP-glucose 4,6-dehydratase